MFEEKFITFANAPGHEGSGLLDLVNSEIVVESIDFPAVHIAARNLAQDFARVTKQGLAHTVHILKEKRDGRGVEDVSRDSHNLTTSSSSTRKPFNAIIIGSIGASPVLQGLEEHGKVNFSKIRGTWESYITAVVDDPFPACRRALIIAGSDKRGAVFGTYSLSEQIGVSPWYWWADVEPQYHPEIYALPRITTQTEPSVRFRGIFINDEAPALTGWAREKFGGYNVEFYKKVFELLLRLKANFLWPAMWPGYPNPGAMFFTEDLENQTTAEEYGICISTSHHEPMQRLSNEWFAENPDGSWDWLTNKSKITDFFDEGVRRAKGRESYFTLGMRGEYDKGMRTEDPAGVVRDVIKTQREIIKKVHGSEDAVPQLLALYKEVQDQYDTGRLDVPDDVTLLFADDNFGTLRRLPYREESKRKGGAGLYYHFEYVGHPRSYKWINSNSLGKTWHQLQEAHRRNAKQIWVFNVGDIKPLEVPITFAMALAWNIDSIKENAFLNFFTTMAEREFGPKLGEQVANIWREYDRLASLRRHEHIEPTTFSLLHNNEAEIITGRWKSLLDTAELIYQKATEELRPSIFQLVLHPVKASFIFVALQITIGRNQLYARQRRNSANKLLKEALDLFDADFSLSEEYHKLLDGKWNHIMMQTHYGFGDTWHAPSRDMISGLCYVQRRQNSNPIAGQMGVMVEGQEGIRPGRCNEESDRTHPSRRDLVPGVTLGAMTRYGPQSRWFDIFTRGALTIHWETRVPYTWIQLSASAGTLVPGEDDERVVITIDWDNVPETFDEEILIDINSQEGDFEQIHVPILGRRITDDFESGFVEGAGYISIPAPACLIPNEYRILPEVGRSSTGSIALNPDIPSPSFLRYEIYTFNIVPHFEIRLYFNMTLDTDPDSPMEYDLIINNHPAQTHRLLPAAAKPGELPSDWAIAVQDCSWVRKHSFAGDLLGKGKHTIGLGLKSANMVVEKLVVDFGGVEESYLGPTDSYFVGVE